MEYVPEEEVPAEFNEMEAQEDGECIIRTLVDFCVRDGEGNFVGIEELGSEKSPFVIVQGTVLEPLSASLREATVNLLCTTPPEPTSQEIAEQSVGEATADSSVQTLDRAALAIGDAVDGYCNKTFKWYEAKIIDIVNDPEKGERLKIHFKGWNVKHDEWIGRNSERIIAPGTSAALMEAATRKATRMVAWYDPDGVDRVLQESVLREYNGTGWSRKQISIEIRGLEDYCIDYSYANPTLWLISSSNIWYRIAGALCPGGRFGSPLASYAKVLQPTVSKFACTAHVAMVLLDFLPSFPKMGVDMVAAEVQNRSNGEFDETVLLSNWQFLVDQLKGISPPAEWDCNVDISKSTFLSQLKKQGDAYVRGGGKAGITSAEEGGLFKRKRGFDGSNVLSLPSLTSSVKLKSGEMLDEEGGPLDFKQLLNKIKFPIEDKDYWHLMGSYQGKPSLPFPAPLFSNLVNSPHRITCPSVLLGSLLHVWATLTNFRTLLQLPPLSLSCLDALILPGHGVFASTAQCALSGGVNASVGSGAGSHAHSYFTTLPSTHIHPLLREINIALLSLILMDKFERGELNDLRINVCDSLRAASRDMDLDEDDVDADTSCFLGWFPPGQQLEPPVDSASSSSGRNTPNKSQQPVTSASASASAAANTVVNQMQIIETKLQNHLRSGDTWVEVFRALIAAQHGLEMKEYLDPISECERIIQTLLRDPDAGPFSKAVNPEKDGVPDYLLVVSEPMDLGTILNRINTGWYDDDGSKSKGGKQRQQQQSQQKTILPHDPTVPKIFNGEVRFSVGNIVDVYNESRECWYDATIINVNAASHSIMVRVRGVGDETLGMSSDRLAPVGTMSSSMTTRVCKPENANTSRFWEELAAKLRANATADASVNAAVPSNPQRTASTTPTTKHGGHEGIAKDVRLVWSNCISYMSRHSKLHSQAQSQPPSEDVDQDQIQIQDHPLVESATALSQQFEALYEKYVLAAVQKPAQVKDPSPKPGGVTTVKSEDSNNSSSSNTAPPQADISLIKQESGADSKDANNDEPAPTEYKFVNKAESKAGFTAEIEHWKHVIRYLSENDYSNASVEVKLLMLTWACTELLQTTRCKTYFDSVVDTLFPKSRGAGKDNTNAPVEEEEEDADASNKRKRGRTSKSGADEEDAEERATVTPAGKSKARKSATPVNNEGGKKRALVESESATGLELEAESSEQEEQAEVFDATIRLNPLGQDREHRTYWAFGDKCNRGPKSADDVPPRIFCEDSATTEWCIFSDERDIQQLNAWLCDKGVRECGLKRALSEWAHAHRVSLAKRNATTATDSKGRNPRKKSAPDTPATPAPQTAESGGGDSAAMDVEDGGAGTMSDDGTTATSVSTAPAASTVATTPARSSNTSSQPSLPPPNPFPYLRDFTSFWSAKELSPLCFCSYVYLNEEFQLGIGLKPLGNQVVVSSMKPDQSGRSAGKEAGLRVGDVIVAVGNALVTEIDVLKRALTAVQAASQARAQRSSSHSVNSSSISQNSGELFVGNPESIKKSRSTTPTTPGSSSVSEERIPARPCLRLLILRYPSARANPVLGGSGGAVEVADATLRNSYKKEEDEEFSKTSSGVYKYFNLPDGQLHRRTSEMTPDPSMHPLKEVHYYPSRVVGALVALLTRAMHPFCVSEEFIRVNAPSWLLQLHQCLLRADELCFQRVQAIRTASLTPTHRRQTKTFLKQEAQLIELENSITAQSSSLLRLLSECMIDFEQALFAAGNMFNNKVWTDSNRFRFKWQRTCKEATTYSKLSLCLSVLNAVIDWSRLATACSCLTLATWTASKQQPKHIRTIIPPENSLVVYFGDGQRAIDTLDSVSGKPAIWGHSTNLSRVNAGVVCSCMITGVRVLLSGPPERFFPFAQIDMIVIQSKLNSTAPVYQPDPRAVGSTISSRNSQSHLGHVYRVVNRAVNTIRVLPEAKAFLEPVNIKEHPDYNEIIADPIDLGMIRLRAREGAYTRVDAFLEDITKLHKNCAKYCETLYPELVEYSNKLLSEAKEFVGLLMANDGSSNGTSSQDSMDVCTSPPPARAESSLNGLSRSGSNGHLGGSSGSSSSSNVTNNVSSVAAAPQAETKRGTVLKGIPLVEGQGLAPQTSFTVCVRLNSTETCPFLIPAKRYADSAGCTFAEGVIIRVCTSKLEHFSEDPATPGFRYGSVIGAKPLLPDGYVPWGWLQVEWADGSAENCFVNPWDVELVSSRLSGSKREMKRLKA